MSQIPASLTAIPDDLRTPADDGACDHLTGLAIPAVALRSTRGREVAIADLKGRIVIYCYPRTGQPGVALPDGWDGIPGARGCTPEACSFRDHAADLAAAGVCEVFGLSTQDPEYQREAAERLHLPFELLSDANLAFARGLNLPTFPAAGGTLIKRVTMIIDDGRITKFFYPVFPPDTAAQVVLDWVRANP